MNSQRNSSLPTVSIIIPTYQAGEYLECCLASIDRQRYPKRKYEVIVVDGGSTDGTLRIAKKYQSIILVNPARDAESGKSIGIEKAKGEVIALVDADNELVGDNWLLEMVKPLMDDPAIFGVESPWLLRRDDPLINQYATLLQIADPLARRLHPQSKIEDRGEYLVYKLRLGETPVVGANGFLWRKKFIRTIGKHKPKFEEVNYIALMVEHGYLVYARMKGVGIYHYYCKSILSYVKKRLKIGRKFLGRKERGQKTWVDHARGDSFLKAVLFNLSIIGPLLEAMSEYRKSRNSAWFLHPLISFLTIMVYGYAVLEYRVNKILR